jgi:alpha-L-fucosidase
MSRRQWLVGLASAALVLGGIACEWVLLGGNDAAGASAVECGSGPHSHGRISHKEQLPPLGLFIHYGPGSLVNADRTTTWWRAIEARSYATTVVPRFQPRRDAATRWVRLAKRMGAGYIVVTAKHHDGYGLWDGSSTYDTGPRDLIAEVSRAARHEGVRLWLYYSLVDLHEPSYENDWDEYRRFVERQLRELLTGYGPIAGVWFDGPGWAHPASCWQLPDLYDFIHRLQPQTMIVTNHHLDPLPGETMQTYEGQMPRESRPWPQQVAFSTADQWFYSTQERPRSHRWYLDLKRRAERAHVSLLINVPPLPSGAFSPAYLRTVR